LWKIIAPDPQGSGLPEHELSPTTCIKLFNTYVLPRPLYGLETFILKPTHFNLLEIFHLSYGAQAN
jgi:hypothetical protein